MTRAQDIDQVWQEDDDPYGYRTRWYEARKRALLLAVLPRQRFARGWEIGCANGELTHMLAARCDALLGTDMHPRAVAVARERCAGLGHVDIQRMEHPRDWPDGRFDLIVVGEMGYYLDAVELDPFARKIEASLAPDAVLLACHWRPGFSARRSSTQDVHARLAAIDGLGCIAHYQDADMLLEAWSSDTVSLAQREGLRGTLSSAQREGPR